MTRCIIIAHGWVVKIHILVWRIYLDDGCGTHLLCSWFRRFHADAVHFAWNDVFHSAVNVALGSFRRIGNKYSGVSILEQVVFLFKKNGECFD